MTPERYQRLSVLFAHGSELHADQRRRFLLETAVSDPDLRDELERLFRMDDPEGLAAPDEREPAIGRSPLASPDNCPEVPGYQIGQLLGEGGMGQVWWALQLSTQRKVALKLIHGIRFTSSQNRARFEREVELTARLAHPNIAQVFDSGFAEGYAFYAMELVSGHSLDQYVRRRQPDELARLQLMLEVCRGVQHAHQRGVIHRDLKPSNVLVTDDGRPVLVDFGLAKCLVSAAEDEPQLTRGMMLGTPEYMSPEQTTGGMTQVDTRSDVYSLGVMLYWLLTNRLPYDSDDPIATIQRVAHHEIVAPRRARPQLDPGLVAVLDKAMARDPNDRYSGAGELADDLQRHLDGEPVTASAVDWWYVARRNLRKNRKTVAVVTLIAGVVLSGLAAFVVMTNRHAHVAIALANRAEQSQRVARQAERNALRMAYIHQLALASNEADRFQFHRARSLLEDCPAELRGWEWRLLRNHVAPKDRSTATIGPFDLPVRRLAFSPDGRRLAIVANHHVTTETPNPLLLICDTASGEVVATLRGHSDGIFAVAFTPDGRQLLSGSRDQTLRRWDVETGELLETVSGPISGQSGPQKVIAFAISFSPDGSRVALAAYPQGLYLADVPAEITWREILAHATHVEQRTGEDDSLAFTTDGRRLAWSTRFWQGNIGHLYLIDTDRAEVVAHLERPPGEPAYSVDFDSRGEQLLTGDLRGSATVYDGDLTHVVGQFRSEDGAVRRAFYNADSSRVVALVGRGIVCVWDDLTRQVRSVLQPAEEISSLEMAISNDRRWIAVATGNPAQVRIWELARVREEDGVVAIHEPKARDVALSPDGSHVATCGDDGRAELRSWPERSLIHTHASGFPAATGVAFSPSGQYLAVGWSQHPDVAPEPPFGRVQVFNVATGEPVSPPIDIPGWVWHLEFDATGEQLVVADGVTPARVSQWPAGAHVIQWLTGERKCSVKVNGPRCRSASLTPDGQVLVTASEATLASWSVPTGQLLSEQVGTQGRNFVRLVAGTDQLITGHESAIEVRQLPDLKLIRTFEHQRDTKAGESNLVGDVALHPEGNLMASGSWNGTLTLWDFESQLPLLTVPAHETGVHRLQFSRDGQTLFSAGHDGRARAWLGDSANH